MTEARYLDALDWLPLDKWSVETIINQEGTPPSTGLLCKICDRRIKVGKAEGHVKGHIREAKSLKLERKEEARLARIETLRLRREEKNAQSEN